MCYRADTEMSSDIRLLALENVEEAIGVINGSSRGCSFQFNLDLARFLAHARFWNFSYRHSYVGYVNGAPAGVLVNSVDPEERQAYSFYWGVLEGFRRRRLSLELVHTYLDQLRLEGYLRTHCETSRDSPVGIFPKLGYQARGHLLELEAARPDPGPQAVEIEVRRLDPGELEAGRAPAERHWTSRSAFLHHAAPMLEILGAYRDGKLVGYAVVTCWTGHTVLLDLEAADASRLSARKLIRYLVENDYPSPYTACMVRPASPAHDRLEAAGFRNTKTFTWWILELQPPAGNGSHAGSLTPARPPAAAPGSAK